jgi:hypothetical protein
MEISPAVQDERSTKPVTRRLETMSYKDAQFKEIAEPKAPSLQIPGFPRLKNREYATQQQ